MQPTGRVYRYMGRQRRLVHLACDRRDDDRGALGVAYVVLNNLNRPYAILLRVNALSHIR